MLYYDSFGSRMIFCSLFGRNIHPFADTWRKQACIILQGTSHGISAQIDSGASPS